MGGNWVNAAAKDKEEHCKQNKQNMLLIKDNRRFLKEIEYIEDKFN